jgi:hypothetical protein
MKTRHLVAFLAVASALLLGACSGSDDANKAASTPAPAAPTAQAPAMPPSMPPPGMGQGMPGASGSPHGDMSQGMGQGMGQKTPPAQVDLKGISKLNGGYTVGEVFQKKASLSGKEVGIRGKVVKMTRGVMGTNWAHVRDGSGAEGSNDITVTTNDVADIGDTVVVRGMLSTDVDIGSGYFFPVVIKDAKVVAEK